MSDFFTPIQVLSPQKQIFEQYEVQKYNDDPFQMTFCRIESLGDHKKKIIQWLKEMPLPQRLQQLSYTNKQFASLFMSMMQRKQQQLLSPIEFAIKQIPFRGYMIQDNKKVHISQSTIAQAEEELLRSLLIMNKFSMFDTLTVNVEIAQNINRLFQLFQIIQNGICHELNQQGIKEYADQGSSLMFYNPNDHNYSFKSIGSWVVEVLKKTISFKYFKNQEDKRKQDSFDVKDKNRKVYKFWKKLQIQKRQKLINKALSEDVRNSLNNYRQIIHVDDDSFPNIIYSTIEKIRELKDILIQDNGQNIFRLLTYTLVQDTIYSLSILKYEILSEIEECIHRQEIKEEIAVMKKKKTPYINNQKTKDKKRQSLEPLQGIPILQQKKQKQSPELQKKSKEKYLQKQKINKKKKKKNPKKYVRCDNSNHQSETTNQPQDSQQQTEIVKEDENQIFAQKKNKELQKIYKKLSEKTAIHDKYRRIAVNRIAYVLQKLHLSYQLFGSFACDLTIPSSDIDICIDPTIVNFFYTSFCSYREKILMSLQFLQNAFEKCPWAKNFNFISTASVPVLMFQVNLNSAFQVMPKDKSYNIPKLHGRQSEVNIMVDLTIQPFANLVEEMVPHLGQHSTQIVREWSNSYSHMKETIRIFKYILQKHNLNKSFMGGLSSFVLSVIVASFFLKRKDKQKLNLYETILDFCEYVYEFRESQQLVDVRSGEKVENKSGNSKLTVINPINGKNLSQYCHKFGQIKEMFNLFHTKLKHQSHQLNQFLGL